MKIILTNDVQNLGKSGDIKDVKAGYARNYLLPLKKAMKATLENIKFYENQQKIVEKRISFLIDEAKLKIIEIKKIKSITISVKANSYGKLFGSITKKDIIKRLKELNILIKYEHIKSKVSIDRIGLYDIQLYFYKDLSTNLQLHIIRN